MSNEVSSKRFILHISSALIHILADYLRSISVEPDKEYISGRFRLTKKTLAAFRAKVNHWFGEITGESNVKMYLLLTDGNS